jgi:Ca2+-binding EF-hand superfamily protein
MLYNHTVQALRDRLLALANTMESDSVTSITNSGTTTASSVRTTIRVTSQRQRQIVRNIFSRIDENGSGVLTIHEMKQFLLSPEITLFNEEERDSTCEKFSQMILEQLDVNRDGHVSLVELEDFLFPESSSSLSLSSSAVAMDMNDQRSYHGSIKTKQIVIANEAGIVIEATRTAVITHVSVAAASGSDEAILDEFATLSKVRALLIYDL